MEQLWHRPAMPSPTVDALSGATAGRAAPSTPVLAGHDPHADLAARTEWVASNFVMSVDGSIAVDGVSGGLGGDGDLVMFRSLRDHADVVLVGAGTARAESYGPTRRRDVEARRARGQAERPVLVLVTRSADVRALDRLWADPEAPVIVLTGTDAPADAVAWARERAEVLAIGDDGPDLRAGLAQLRARGLGRILTEGGPSLQADLLRQGLVTDMFTTVAPLVVGGATTSVPTALPSTTTLSLTSVWHHDGEVFLHHRVAAVGASPDEDATG